MTGPLPPCRQRPRSWRDRLICRQGLPLGCSDWFNAGNPTCRGGITIERAELVRDRAPVLASLAGLSSAYPALVVWDPLPLLCPDPLCRAVTPAGPLFFDGDHLSNLANHLLYPDFLALLGSLHDVSKTAR